MMYAVVDEEIGKHWIYNDLISAQKRLKKRLKVWSEWSSKFRQEESGSIDDPNVDIYVLTLLK